MVWSLYEGDKFLEPLVFSNGKSQSDIVNEVLKEIEKGCKIIFIHGVCGTGKSAIALNIARKLGKSSVVVPGKNLQAQYKKDYEHNKYLKKENGEKLNISVITGRNNHKCQFLLDNKNAVPVIKKEVNSNLHDIFAGKKEEADALIGDDISAENYKLPCKIEIKEKNWYKIKKYLKQNNKIDIKNFNTIKDVRRVSVATVCPYWCPVLDEKYEFGKIFGEAKKKTYEGLDGRKFNVYQRKSGCPFYEQFNSFVDSDVIVFNSLKYKLESLLNRKPLTEVEIIDECDEFLDGFANQKNINLDRLQNALIHVIGNDEAVEKAVGDLHAIIKQLRKDERINDAIYSKEIIPLKETGVYDLLGVFMNTSEILDAVDDESYLFDVFETTRMFDEFLNETYITVNKKDNNLILSLVTTNLEKKFKEMVDKNKLIVLMSGTLHSNSVLKNVFGLEDYKIVEAETMNQGNIEVQKTGLEMDCKYANFSLGRFTRRDYLEALDKSVEIAKKPTLVHINAFLDLPTEEEIVEFNLKNLIARKKLRDLQYNDKSGEMVKEFKQGESVVLFSTRASRGMDFPGNQCNSIVFTKYPNPNVQDAFWKILMKTKPHHYWDFYKDKARRELWQKVYRGVRYKDDHVYVLSPDSRVLDVFGSDKI